MGQWVFRSHFGDGPKDSPDPKERTCVRYGDTVILQSDDNTWLMSSGMQVKATDRSSSDYDDCRTNSAQKQSFLWKIEAEHNSQAQGCVSEGDKIHLMGCGGISLMKKDADSSVGAAENDGSNNFKWTVEMNPSNIGDSCFWDRGCDSGRCSKNLICEAKLENGENCGWNGDCASGRCEITPSMKSIFRKDMDSTCQSRSPNGRFCTENSDCQSNECSWGFTCGKKCFRDNGCSSGRCSKHLV